MFLAGPGHLSLAFGTAMFLHDFLFLFLVLLLTRPLKVS